MNIGQLDGNISALAKGLPTCSDGDKVAGIQKLQNIIERCGDIKIPEIVDNTELIEAFAKKKDEVEGLQQQIIQNTTDYNDLKAKNELNIKALADAIKKSKY